MTLIFYQYEHGTTGVIITEGNIHYSTARHYIPTGTKYTGKKYINKLDIKLGPRFVEDQIKL